MYPIARRELLYAQAALLLAVILQTAIPQSLQIGSQYFMAALEVWLIFVIGFTAPKRHSDREHTHKTFSLLLIGLVSLANAAQLFLLTKALVHGVTLPGKTLLGSALAIFITNIIVFGLWYWELDSPGLSGRHRNQRAHFQFPQSGSASKERKNWQPSFLDYLYVSTTNASAFSPTDAMPLTHIAKALMGTQALISLITVILVTARAVNILI